MLLFAAIFGEQYAKYGSHSSNRISLLILGGLLQPTKLIWASPGSVQPMSKKMDRLHHLPQEGFSDSLLVEAAVQRPKGELVNSISSDKNGKEMDLLGRTGFHVKLRAMNYQATVVCQQYYLWKKMSVFNDLLVNEQTCTCYHHRRSPNNMICLDSIC